MSAGVEIFSDTTSLLTSAVFAFPEVSDDVYTCGAACIRMPLSDFVEEGSTFFDDSSTEGENILCVITLTNRGDLFCNSILETTRVMQGRQSAVGLPVGASALVVPKELDGKIKQLQHQSIKPTGGMNLHLFITNLYPTLLSRLPIPHPNKQTSSSSRIGVGGKMKKKKRKGKVKHRRHPSLKLGQDPAIYRIAPTISSDISITQDHGNGNDNEVCYKIANRRKHLHIPKDLIKRQHQKIVVGRNMAQQPIELGVERRSDVTLEVIQRAKDFWDDMDDNQYD